MTDQLIQAERAFRAMGTWAHVLVWTAARCPVAPEDLLDAGEAEVARLERRWSRFLSDSDVGRLNRAHGRAITVDPDTVALLELCAVASDRTGGWFDPRILPELCAAGYDRTFDEIDGAARRGPDGDEWGSVAAQGLRDRRPLRSELTLDPVGGTAALTPGRAIDLGGIGKGRSADLVAAVLHDLGATAACVNLGGDLRVVGEVPGGGLLVDLDDPFGGAPAARWSVADAGIATSSRLRRRWRSGGEDRHHLIDPSTGRPAATDIVAVSVVAPTAAWADVLAKVVLLAGTEATEAGLVAAGAAATITRRDGHVETLGRPPAVAMGSRP